MKIIHIIGLFLIETFLQVLYYTVFIRYFEEFRWDDRIGKIFGDSLYVFGSVKAVFVLPIYLLFYLLVAKRLSAGLSVGLTHGTLFFVLLIVGTIVLPVNFFRNLYDPIFLTFIAFGVAFFYSKIFSFPNRSVSVS
jgi:hypothetical protein